MSDFVSFIRSLGLEVDYAAPDGRIHRVRTSDKRHRRNGAYRFFGTWGWGQNWAVHLDPVVWSNGQSPEVLAREQRRVQELDDAERRHAATKAREILNRCSFGPHRYLAMKGFPEEQGLLDTDGRLVVPMWLRSGFGPIASVQWIDDMGEKRFLPGGRAKGTGYVIGPRSGVRWYVEGLATGYSVLAGLKALYRPGHVVVCWFAANLAAVASNGYVFADHDDNKERAGQAAAESTGLSWVMSPTPGEDANDLHQRAGVRAVAELMRSVMT